MKIQEILTSLKAQANPSNIKGMSRFGINVSQALGISIPILRKMARNYKNDHETALGLWNSGIHEARLLAAFVDDPALVTESQMDKWVYDFNSWDICDQTCSCLFDKTTFAFKKARNGALKKKNMLKEPDLQ